MRVFGGLKPEDWTHWGQFTTFKTNAAELVARELRAGQVIYCSPVVDPYQPVEAKRRMMPAILEEVARKPPARFVVQTRGPLVVRDSKLLRKAGAWVSFSITTDDDAVRRIYEPHCAPVAERFAAVRELREAGIPVFVTLAPLLPCDPERLVGMALDATDRPVIADGFHARSAKARGATTREAGVRISEKHGWGEWHDPGFQADVLETMKRAAGARLVWGIAGFAVLAKRDLESGP